MHSHCRYSPTVTTRLKKKSRLAVEVRCTKYNRTLHPFDSFSFPCHMYTNTKEKDYFRHS